MPHLRRAAALLLVAACGQPPGGDAGRDPARPESAGAGRTIAVRVWFSNPGLEPEPRIDCGVVFPVSRTVAGAAAPAQAALEALLAGPTGAERGRGYVTNINPGVAVRSVSISDGVATVDFSAEMERSGGACLVTAIRAQVESTLTQFPGVSSVRIAIEGNTEAILQP